MIFPKDFLWGAATSAYQVEGNNANCDWWEWEKRAGLKETSGAACRHYELYKEDFALARELGHNCHRLSVEWSRIEPQEGKFSEDEITHYREVILSLRQNNLEPIVTLHHFTNPLWFARLGGWESKKSCDYFARYVSRITEALCDKVRLWATINEPMVYVYQAYILGAWPPQGKSFSRAKKVTGNLLAAHVKAYRAIHSLYRRKNLAQPSVSVAKNVQFFSACQPTLRNKLAVYLRNKYFNFDFIDRLMRQKSLDFIGLNYYTRGLVDVGRWRWSNLFLETCAKGHSTLKKNSLGWDIYPEGLYNLLLGFKRYALPLLILENGVSTDDDFLRWDFILQHLKSIHSAMGQGVRVLGYVYWSLLDNFEWDKGFGPRFGLVEVDYSNYKRTPRESARKFAGVCRTGRLD